LRLSFCVDTGRPWAEVRRIGERADATGWHAVYVPDHFLRDGPRGPMLESWAVLSALGAVTGRVRLGSLVLGNTYRQPLVVARMAAALDQITGGRVVLGLGAGWQPNEHAAYGIDLPPPGERLDRLEEACRVITALLRGPDDSLRRRDATPLRSRLPILIGGAGPRRTARIAATYAGIWHCWAPPAEFRRRCEVIDRQCALVGRDPAELERATGQTVRVTAKRRSDQPADDVIGTPEQIVEKLGEYARNRVTEFIVRDDHATDVEEILQTISVLSTEVSPHLT
jgi:alkanesulfonate monooxygenase SsuD/methylene tetrahydromethanopterin reductase-like flavin-dependent oxidoreductase (luciferase family)